MIAATNNEGVLDVSAEPRVPMRSLRRQLEEIQGENRNLRLYAEQLERSLQRAEARVDMLIGVVQPTKKD